MDLQKLQKKDLLLMIEKNYENHKDLNLTPSKKSIWGHIKSKFTKSELINFLKKQNDEIKAKLKPDTKSDIRKLLEEVESTPIKKEIIIDKNILKSIGKVESKLKNKKADAFRAKKLKEKALKAIGKDAIKNKVEKVLKPVKKQEPYERYKIPPLPREEEPYERYKIPPLPPVEEEEFHEVENPVEEINLHDVKMANIEKYLNYLIEKTDNIEKREDEFMGNLMMVVKKLNDKIENLEEKDKMIDIKMAGIGEFIELVAQKLGLEGAGLRRKKKRIYKK
jgi:hypothetical protein